MRSRSECSLGGTACLSLQCACRIEVVSTCVLSEHARIKVQSGGHATFLISADAEPSIVRESKQCCEKGKQLADVQHRIVESIIITVDPPHKVYLLPHPTGAVIVQAAEFP